MHDEQIGEAVLIRVELVKGVLVSETAGLPKTDDPSELGYLHRHSGCRACPRPCHFLHRLRDFPGLARPAEFARLFIASDGYAAWSAWTKLRTATSAESDQASRAGLVYCAAVHAVRSEIGRLMAIRDRAGGLHAAATRLAQDGLTATAAQVLADWAAAPTYGSVEQNAFGAFKRIAEESLFQTPPREMPGCAMCPARCRLLLTIGDELPKLAQGIEAAALSRQPTQRRLEMARVAVDPVVRRAGVSPEDWQSIAYCALVNSPMKSATAADRDSMLTELRHALSNEKQ